MLTATAYAAPSEVLAEGGRAELRLSPNLRRERAHIRARLRDPLAFRDAMLALHDCARSELYASPEEIRARQMDPVITVTPREVFFEAFSLDESTYARV